ncbi:MAG: DEAD/DEAH box helicase, partial [Alphaproteobacteria bacterium]
MSFAYLGLSDELLKAIEEVGYKEPTPIQRQAIPAVLQGRDIIGIAQTGTGKTAAFVWPMLDILATGRVKARMPRSLILEPTRELAHQVAENFERYGKYHKLSMALLIGGVSFAEQEAKLERGVDVLIATPGRLLDHFERGKLLLTGIEIVVVDECDRMLDMGFIPSVERIMTLMPQRHQTLFFSATLPPEVKKLTDRFLDDPKVIEVAPPSSPAETVDQSLVVVGPREKTKALRRLLETEEIENAIVFCNRKADVRTVYLSLKRAKYAVGQLHGDMSQPDRLDTLQRFRDGEITILVASDVAARGLDIAKVSHVFNFDVPQNAEDYIHRIGRTGRAGRHGVAVTIATPEDARALAAIERLIRRRIPERELPGVKTREMPREALAEDGTARRRRRKRKRTQRPEAGTPSPAAGAGSDRSPAARSEQTAGDGEARSQEPNASPSSPAGDGGSGRVQESAAEEKKPRSGKRRRRRRKRRGRDRPGEKRTQGRQPDAPLREEERSSTEAAREEREPAAPPKLGEGSPVPAFLRVSARPRRRR